MPKILAVFGATGQQGGSLIEYVLNDPELSQKYSVRAITRDVKSDKARQLSERIEVVYGDVTNRPSIEAALAGAHTVFAMTAPSFGPDGFNDEYSSGKTIADAAVENKAEYIIFSTLPAVKEISGGKYTKVTPFDAKAAVEQYIRGLSIRSAFYLPGGFMQNFQGQPFLAPKEETEGNWIMIRHNSPNAKLPLIDAVGDTGKFVGAILAQPEKFEGKTLYAATANYSLKEVATTMTKTTGKNVVYKQVSREEFKQILLPLGDVGDVFVEGFSYMEEYGYFGPNTNNLFDWTVENARGRLTTFEEFLQAHPLQLA